MKNSKKLVSDSLARLRRATIYLEMAQHGSDLSPGQFHVAIEEAKGAVALMEELEKGTECSKLTLKKAKSIIQNTNGPSALTGKEMIS